MEQQTRKFRQTLDRATADERTAFMKLIRASRDEDVQVNNLVSPEKFGFYIPPDKLRDITDAYYDRSMDGSISDIDVHCVISGRAGIYLDMDLRYKYTLFAKDADPDSMSLEIATEYIKEYLADMGKIVDIGQKYVDCRAVVMLRTSMDKIDVVGEPVWKHGVHIYFNSISFSRNAREKAYENLLERVNDCLLGQMLLDRTAVPIKDQLDGSPLHGSPLFPYSTKPGGVRYKHACNWDFKVTKLNKGFAVGPMKTTYDPIDKALLYAMLPISEKGRIDSKSDIDGVEESVNLTANAVDTLASGIDNALTMLGEDDCPMAALIVNLLRILPPKDYAMNHDHRLWITNCCAHELPFEWAVDVLFWYYNLEQPKEERSEYHTKNTIIKRIQEAIVTGQKAGIGKLQKVAVGIDKQAALETIARYKVNTVEDSIMEGFRLRKQTAGKPTNTAAANGLYALVGKNYASRQANSGGKDLIRHYEFYHYDEHAPIGPIFRKWYKLHNVSLQIEQDTDDHLIPQLKILQHTYSGLLNSLEEGQTQKRKTLLEKLMYVRELEASLGYTGFREKLATEFTKKVARVSNKSKFGKRLNSDPYLTGVHNGILRFDPTMGVFTLLADDNRGIAVSRSLGGIWDPNMTDESPEYKELMRIGQQIMPDPAIFYHRMVTRGAAIFAGGGGSTLEGNFGTGSDGKTAWSEGELAAGGYNQGGADNELSGYTVQHSPLVWQVPKKQADGHDASILFLEYIRYGVSAEPDESNPYIDGSALKRLLSHATIHVRAPHAPSGRFIKIAGYFVMQHNIPMTLKNANEGNARRYILIESGAKFYDAMNKHLYEGRPNTYPADEGVRERMRSDPNLANAMIRFWVKGAIEFATKYACQITRVPPPECAMAVTKRLLVAADIFRRYSEIKLTVKADGRIPLKDVIADFTTWKNDIESSLKNPPRDNMNTIMTQLCVSSLARFIVGKSNEILTPNRIISEPIKNMCLIGHVFQKVEEADEEPTRPVDTPKAIDAPKATEPAKTVEDVLSAAADKPVSL